MAIAENGPTLVGPSPQAARATSTGMGPRHSGLGAHGSHSFAALMNGIAERSQPPEEVPPGDDARQQQTDRHPQIDRGRAKPTSSGRGVSDRSSRPGEAAAEETDTADAAIGTPGSRRLKTTGVGSERSRGTETSSEERARELVAAVLQIPQIVPSPDTEQAFAVEPLVAIAPAAQSAGLPSGAPAPADGLSSAGTIAAIGLDAHSADVDAAAASAETILEVISSTPSTDVEAPAASKVEVPLLDGASRAANMVGATGRGSVQGRHGDVRSIALSAVRDALAGTVQSQLPTDGSGSTSTPIDSLSADASVGTHDVPAALAAYSLVGSSGIDATLVSKSAASQSTDDASSYDGLEGLQTELMPTGDETPLKSIPAEIRSMPLRSWIAPTTTTDRSALAGTSAPAPGVEPAPSGIKTHAEPAPNVVDRRAPFLSVTAASEIVAVAATPQRTGQVTTPDGVTSARRTLGPQGESNVAASAAMPSQVPPATADLVRDANVQVASEALESVDASGEKQQSATLSVSVDVPVRDAPRVVSLRRPQTGVGSPPSVPAASKESERGPTRQVAAVNPTDTVADAAAGPARQTRQSGGRSATHARDPNQFNVLAEQNLGVASTTATSTASPARKTEVLTQASPRPTGTAAIAIAAFQAAAAAAPDVHRSASTGGASVMSAALLDAQVRTPIVDAITFQADNGNGQVRLRLNPEFLGEVSVDVRVNGGSVVASVHASSADVREWLRTNEAVLRQTLAEQGLHLERLVIAEEDAQPDTEHPDQQREGASDQQRERERRSRRPRDTGTFEVVL